MSQDQKQNEPPLAIFEGGRLRSSGVVDALTMSRTNYELDRLRNESERLSLLAADGLTWHLDLLEAVTDECTVH